MQRTYHQVHCILRKDNEDLLCYDLLCNISYDPRFACITGRRITLNTSRR
jgi:hypothetical protein